MLSGPRIISAITQKNVKNLSTVHNASSRLGRVSLAFSCCLLQGVELPGGAWKSYIQTCSDGFLCPNLFGRSPASWTLNDCRQDQTVNPNFVLEHHLIHYPTFVSRHTLPLHPATAKITAKEVAGTLTKVLTDDEPEVLGVVAMKLVSGGGTTSDAKEAGRAQKARQTGAEMMWFPDPALTAVELKLSYRIDLICESGDSLRKLGCTCTPTAARGKWQRRSVSGAGLV
jgi:hypothetical protein